MEIYTFFTISGYIILYKVPGIRSVDESWTEQRYKKNNNKG